MLNVVKKEYFIFTVIIFYFCFSLNHIINGGIFYDDWSLTVGYLSELSFKDKFNDLVFKTFLTRPVGGFYITFLTELNKLDFLYIFINSTLWLVSSIIICNSFKNYLSKKSRNIILILLLFPSFASTMIFSPVTQTLGVLSIFFWSISIFFAEKQKKKVSFLFFIISVLTYEVSVVLLFFNIFFLSTKNQNYLIKNISKLLFFFVFIVVGIIIFQMILSKITGYSASLKYGFWFDNNQLIFEEDFFKNIKKYFFKPIILIVYDIPNLLIKSIMFVKFNMYSIFVLLAFFWIIFLNISLEEKHNKLSKKISNTLFLTILSSTISVFFVYLIVTSVPQVNGYYNRGLVGLFICFCIFLGFINNLNFKNKIYNNIKLLFISLFLILNFNSFLVQQINHVNAEDKRDELLEKVSNFYNKKKNENTEKRYQPIYLMITPTHLKENYNDEVIFSEEVEDLYFAVNYVTNKNVLAKRIFYDRKCSKIINIENNSITGFITSRNRKYADKVKTTFYEFSLKDRDIYLYHNSNFTKLTYNNFQNEKILMSKVKCLL